MADVNGHGKPPYLGQIQPSPCRIQTATWQVPFATKQADRTQRIVDIECYRRLQGYRQEL
jgi:hypothetical protein